MVRVHSGLPIHVLPVISYLCPLDELRFKLSSATNSYPVGRLTAESYRSSDRPHSKLPLLFDSQPSESSRALVFVGYNLRHCGPDLRHPTWSV
jgi:hypothetical protein